MNRDDSGRRAGLPDGQSRRPTAHALGDPAGGRDTATTPGRRRTNPPTGEPVGGARTGPTNPDTSDGRPAARRPSRTAPPEGTGLGRRPGDRVGIRELRNNVAAVVRRATAGERIVVTVDGVPIAQLGPLQPDTGPPSLDDLIAAGLVLPPGRHDHPDPPEAEDVPVDVRPDAVLDELRGT